MAATRYGIIHHERNSINLRFPSPATRAQFAEDFNAYHAAHDHDGETPHFENIARAEIVSYERTHNYEDVTIDGYARYEIQEYHENKEKRYVRYKPPTCCVPPLIVVDTKIVESGDLQRHELSAIFGDMPAPDYASLLESVRRDGFIENTIKLLNGQVLDGWHRYRAAQELNLIRKLKFQEWNPDPDRDGDPKVFVLARNIERRHLAASQRAQIAVTFNERFGHGGDRSKSQNGDLKTRKDLAVEAKVSTRTIDRAVKIEKAGHSEAVITGEKTAAEVLTAEKAKATSDSPAAPETNGVSPDRELIAKQRALQSTWDSRKQAATDYVGTGNTDLNQLFSLPELEKAFAQHHHWLAAPFQTAMGRMKAGGFEQYQAQVFAAGIEKDTLEDEARAWKTYAYDILTWERQDWIQQLILAKKAGQHLSAQTPPGDPAPPTSQADPDPETPSEILTLTQQTLQQFEAKLDALGATDTLLDEILHFYHGIEAAEALNTCSEGVLQQVNGFFQGFMKKPPHAWPEWIQHQLPKRELVEVAIGINNNTTGEFEMVEFTDEHSDAVWCKLEELPEPLRNALLNIAVQKRVEKKEAEPPDAEM